MNTTNLFVELMVIGIGALSAVLLGIGAFLSPEANWMQYLMTDNVATILILAPTLAVTYVLGIVVDRLADWLFGTLWTSRLRRQHFGDDIETYHQGRRAVLSGPAKLAFMFEYARSRMRICRGWTINAFFLGIAWNLFAARQLQEVAGYGGWWLVGNLFAWVLLVGCWLAWRTLVSGIYQKVRHIYDFLREHSMITSAGTMVPVEEGYETEEGTE